MVAQLETINFRGDDLQVTVIDGKPFVVVRTVFENVGLQADHQVAKLQKQPWATTRVTPVVAADGKVRDMIVADVRTILMALATVPPSRVKVDVRDALIAYQAEVADVIEAYFTKHAAINHRVTEEQLPAVVERAVGDYRTERERRIAEEEAERRALVSISQAQLSMLRAAKDLLDEQWLTTKAQVVVARGLGEAPAIEQEDLPLYVEEFMHSKGVSWSKVRRFSGAFGKKILAEAVLDGTPIPGKRIQELPDGSIREITAWTKEHLPIFERAWSSSYANDVRLMSSGPYG